MKPKLEALKRLHHRICKCPCYSVVGSNSQRMISLPIALSSYLIVRCTNNSKQIIATQKQYDFLESLTSEIPFPPSRPSTPPAPSASTRRRRKHSPSVEQTPTNNHDGPPKRKRRSSPKEIPEERPEEVKTEPMEEVKLEHPPETPAEDKHRRGWFDIVMGSNEQDSSEDESYKKRRYFSSPAC